MNETIMKSERICYVAVLMSDNSWSAGVVIEGEKGYYLTDWDWHTSEETARRLVDDLNIKLGLTEIEAVSMTLQSMKK